MSISNNKGEKNASFLDLRTKPYETCLYPNLYFENLTEFLDGQDGSASINFNLETSLLVTYLLAN